MNQPGSAPDEDDPARRLAEQALPRLAAGESLDLRELAERLPESGARRRFLDLVEGAQQVRELLPRALRPGAVLAGRYRLVREIGSGGMGRVFEALDTQLERRVAIKVLTMLGGQSFDPERQFLNEAVLLAGLQHPNIVAVHELGTHEETPFLVMDLVDGTPLSEVLERVRTALREQGPGQGAQRPRAGEALFAGIGRPVPAGQRPPPAGEGWFRAVARVALELARTLEAAHERGIVHRDLKPANVLLRGGAMPVVLDFGLAGTRDHAGDGVTRGLYGTVAYLAPEQVTAGRVGTDPRTDVYQLGLVLYEMLVLQRAFPGDELSAILGRVGRGEFLRPRAIDRGVPAELEAVCLRAMELDPARRYASVTALREDLQRWVEEGVAPLAARGGSLASGLRQMRYAVRRHRLGLAVAATAVAALLTWFVLKPPTPPWSGQLVAFRESVGATQVQIGAEFAAVKPGDVLGIALRGDAPAWIYALSVFGPEDQPRRFVTPMVATIPGHADEPAADGWGLLVQPGELVACTQVDDAVLDGQHEGLLVFASPHPQPRLAAWLDSLQAAAARRPDGAVPYEEARAAFRDALVTRGSRVQLSDEQGAALAELSAAAVLGEEEWRLSDPQRWEFSFPVRH